jgi:hypothetical protein
VKRQPPLHLRSIRLRPLPSCVSLFVAAVLLLMDVAAFNYLFNRRTATASAIVLGLCLKYEKDARAHHCVRVRAAALTFLAAVPPDERARVALSVAAVLHDAVRFWTAQARTSAARNALAVHDASVVLDVQVVHDALAVLLCPLAARAGRFYPKTQVCLQARVCLVSPDARIQPASLLWACLVQ